MKNDLIFTMTAKENTVGITNKVNYIKPKWFQKKYSAFHIYLSPQKFLNRIQNNFPIIINKFL